MTLPDIVKMNEQLGQKQNSSQGILSEVIYEDSAGRQSERITRIQEQKRLEALKKVKCFIKQDSMFKVIWDLYVIVLVLINCITIPYQVSFAKMETFVNDDKFKYFEIFVIDLSFVIDIIINFRTSYFSRDTGVEVTDPKLIARNYACSMRFLLDLVASIPFDLLISPFFEIEEDNEQQ